MRITFWPCSTMNLGQMVFLLILKLAYQCKKPKTLNRACERPSLKMGRLKKVWCKRKIVLISILVMAIYSLVCHANTWFISDIKRLEGPLHRKWFSRGRERRVNLFFRFDFWRKKLWHDPTKPTFLFKFPPFALVKVAEQIEQIFCQKNMFVFRSKIQLHAHNSRKLRRLKRMQSRIKRLFVEIIFSSLWKSLPCEFRGSGSESSVE